MGIDPSCTAETPVGSRSLCASSGVNTMGTRCRGRPRHAWQRLLLCSGASACPLEKQTHPMRNEPPDVLLHAPARLPGFSMQLRLLLHLSRSTTPPGTAPPKQNVSPFHFAVFRLDFQPLLRSRPQGRARWNGGSSWDGRRQWFHGDRAPALGRGTWVMASGPSVYPERARGEGAEG